jgi:hypothetical protein
VDKAVDITAFEAKPKEEVKRGWLSKLLGISPERQQEMAKDIKKHLKEPSLEDLIKPLDYPAGITRTAVTDVLRRAIPGGRERVPSEDWMRALKGEAKVPSEFLEESGYQLGPWQRLGVDIGGGALLDPLGLSTTGVKTGARAVARLAKAGPDVMEFLQPFKVRGPLQKILRGVGRKVYGTPFRQAEAELLFSGKNIPPGTLTSMLQKSDVGGFTKSNIKILDEIMGVGRRAYQPVAKALRSAEPESIAPNFVNNVRKIRARDIMRNPKLKPSQKISQISRVGKEGNIVRSIVKGLDDKNSLNATMKVLNEAAPEYRSIFSKVRSAWKTGGQRKDLKDFMEVLTTHLTVDAPKDFRRMLADKASFFALGEEFGGEIGNIAKAVSSKIDDKIGAMAVKQGLPKEAYNQAKRDYEVISTAVTEAIKKSLLKSEKMAKASKLDVFMAVNAAINPEFARHFAAFGAAKLGQMVGAFPAIGTGLGKAITKTGEFGGGALDHILRRAVIEGTRSPYRPEE